MTLPYRSVDVNDRPPHFVAWSIAGISAQIIVAGLLQDELINGDGHSWDRANRIGSVPVGLLIAFSIIAMLNAMKVKGGTFRLVAGWTFVALAIATVIWGLLPD